MHSKPLYAALLALPALVAAQSAPLAGKVGPLTSIAAKKAVKTCDITSYGAKADGKTDVSPALMEAFNACKGGGVVVVPSGDYALENWVSMNGGKAWALQLDGVISRTGLGGGNMIFIGQSSDFELFSSTGKGALQGHGYQMHGAYSGARPRIMRFRNVSNFSVHDLAIVDSPAFHFSMDTCATGEVYNVAIRGGNMGGLDGIDVWGDHIWVHDVMVTNRDECVTVKNPSHNLLIENIYCNWSGGCAMGSLGGGTDISNITYKNVYTWRSEQMYMIKSHGGSGTVSNLVLENFIGHGNAYSLDINQYWASMSAIDGPGVQLQNIAITNWTGSETNGQMRGPVKVVCADGAPCTGVDISDFAMWTESGSEQFYSCQSAYTNLHRSPPLFCLHGGSDHVSYPLTRKTVTAAPTGYAAPTMTADLATAFGTTDSIPIPTIPATFYPGVPAMSKLPAGYA